MNIIAAADLNWGIGKDGDLLDHIPEDMKFFREKTMGKAVIMGKKTFLSFPNQKPLPKRLNIVLTHDESFCPEGVTVCKNMEDAIAEARKEYNADRFILNFDEINEWHIANEEMIKTEKGLYITFVTYKKDV